MAVERTEVIKSLKHMLVEEIFVEVPEDEIKEDDSLMTLGVDSVGRVDIFTLIEEKYGIKIGEGPEMTEKTRTLGLFADYIVASAAAQ